MSIRQLVGSSTYDATITFREKPEMKFKVKDNNTLIKFKFNPILQGELSLKDAEKCFENWLYQRWKKEYAQSGTVTMLELNVDLEDFVFKHQTIKESEFQYFKLKDVMHNGENYKIKVNYKVTLQYAQSESCCKIF
eukprot:403366054